MEKIILKRKKEDERARKVKKYKNCEKYRKIERKIEEY